MARVGNCSAAPRRAAWPNGSCHTQLPALADFSPAAYAPRKDAGRTLDQVLAVEQVGRHDDFFALGGDSILATQLIVRVREATHVEVSPFSFFEAPTVAGMARSIEALIVPPGVCLCHCCNPSLSRALSPYRIPSSVCGSSNKWDSSVMRTPWWTLCVCVVLSISWRSPRACRKFSAAMPSFARPSLISRATAPGYRTCHLSPALHGGSAGLSRRYARDTVHAFAQAEAQRSFDLTQGPLLHHACASG